jgi:hypothetical protein
MRQNTLVYTLSAVVLAVAITLLWVRGKSLTLQDCLTGAQTNTSAILCGIMGLTAAYKVATPAAQAIADRAEIQRLTKDLEKALAEKEAMRQRSDELDIILSQRVTVTEPMIREALNWPAGADPVGNDFFVRFNEAICTGADATDYCTGGEVLD